MDCVVNELMKSFGVEPVRVFLLLPIQSQAFNLRTTVQETLPSNLFRTRNMFIWPCLELLSGGILPVGGRSSLFYGAGKEVEVEEEQVYTSE